MASRFYLHPKSLTAFPPANRRQKAISESHMVTRLKGVTPSLLVNDMAETIAFYQI